MQIMYIICVYVYIYVKTWDVLLGQVVLARATPKDGSRLPCALGFGFQTGMVHRVPNSLLRGGLLWPRKFGSLSVSGKLITS